MLRRLISHPNRPGVHALIALAIVIVAIVILLLVAKSAGAAGYQEALRYYEKVLTVDASKGRVKQVHDRAQANIAAIKYFELFDPAKVPDGSYKASSQAYEGPLEVTVTVAGGMLTSVRVTNHREKQYYSALTDTPQKIIAKQAVKGIDTTSNATITSEAIVNATAKAIGER